MKKLIPFLLLLAASFPRAGLSEAIDLTLNSDVASQSITGKDSPYWDAGSVQPDAYDIIFGYGSKHALTLKRDGRILDSEGKEIATDIELVQKLRNALNGICK